MGEFFKSFIAESKRIVWPNKKELISKTGSVITLSLIVAVILFAMDLIFSTGFNLLHQLVK